MQLTFILGNGFDIAIGMKTGYKNFYEWYEKQPDESPDVTLMKAAIKSGGIWADFELALGQFTNVITDKERFIKVFELARQALIRYLTEEYEKTKAENEDFLKSATYCLVELSQNLPNELPEESRTLFALSKDVHTTFNCITFNYTPVLSEGHKDMEVNAGGISGNTGWWGTYEIGKMLSVHGQLYDFPILGVDNPEQIANESFRDDPDILQLMVKGEIDKKLGRNWRAEAQEIINNSDKIYVYGASLGETDAFWWKTLAKWYEDDPENRQLALYCHPHTNEDQIKENQESFVRNISKHFTRGDYVASIVVDSAIKKMTVKFVRMSARAQIKTSCSAKLSVVPASEVK